MTASNQFPLDQAQLVALFMTSICYGVLLTAFLGCLHVLLWSREDQWFRRISNISFVMLVPALLMFIFSSLDLAFLLHSNLIAFTKPTGTGAGTGGNKAVEEFQKTTNWVVYLKMVNYVAQTCIGDGVLIYRCWIVYNRKWLIVLVPTIMWIAGTGCGIVTCVIEAQLVADPKLLNSSVLVPFITAMLSLTLITNLTSTSLIVFRIWSVRSASPRLPRDNNYPNNNSNNNSSSNTNCNTRLTKVTRVLVESGLIYTFAVVALFAVYLTSNNAQYAVSDTVVQIIGITFYIIIIRVHQDTSTDNPSVAGLLHRQIDSHPHGQHRFRSQAHIMPMTEAGVSTIKVHTTVQTFRDADSIAEDANPTTYIVNVPLTPTPVPTPTRSSVIHVITESDDGNEDELDSQSGDVEKGVVIITEMPQSGLDHTLESVPKSVNSTVSSFAVAV